MSKRTGLSCRRLTMGPESDPLHPEGVAVLPSGTIVVCDFDNSRLVLVKEDGNFLRTIGDGKGSGPNHSTVQTTQWSFLAASSSWPQFVKEDGTFLKSIGNGRGSGHNQFDQPTFIARLPSRILAVSDSINKRLQFLQEDGSFLGLHACAYSRIAVFPDEHPTRRSTV